MAGQLLDAGYKVVRAINRTQPSADLLAKELTLAGSAREVAAAPAWWAVTGSNRRPSRCKRDALPTELTALTCQTGTCNRIA